MVALLQPPPLLAVLVVVVIAAAALWFGFGLRSVDDLRRPWGQSRAPEDSGADRPARGASGASGEAREVWGTPDPLPPARTPFSYDRFVVHEAEDAVEAAPVALDAEGAGAETQVHPEPAVRQHVDSQAEPDAQPASQEEPLAALPALDRRVPSPPSAEGATAEQRTASPAPTHGEESPPPEVRMPPVQERTKEEGEPAPPREISLADIFTRTQRPHPPE